MVKSIRPAAPPHPRSASADAAVVLFPGALGDFVCLLPALRGLYARHGGRLGLVARPALLELLRWPGLRTASIDRREVADLFATGALRPETHALFAAYGRAYSWTGFADAGFAARLAAAMDRDAGAVAVFRFRGLRDGEHAADYYAGCAGVPAGVAVGSVLAADADWLAPFARRHGLGDRPLVVLHPGSGAAAKNWTGFATVAAHYAARGAHAVVVLLGPAERERPHADIAGTITARGLSLPQVVALLRRCSLYLGNDSGISHLAGAAGAHGVACFGPTDPRTWAPRGSLRVLHASADCPRCPDELCTHCLPVERVLEELAYAASAG